MHKVTHQGRETLNIVTISPFVLPSVCLFVSYLQLNNGAFQGYDYYRTLIGIRCRKTNRGQRCRVATGVAETATKTSPALLQKHSLGGSTTCQAGDVPPYRLCELRYPTAVVWAADLQHSHGMLPSKISIGAMQAIPRCRYACLDHPRRIFYHWLENQHSSYHTMQVWFKRLLPPKWRFGRFDVRIGEQSHGDPVMHIRAQKHVYTASQSAHLWGLGAMPRVKWEEKEQGRVWKPKVDMSRVRHVFAETTHVVASPCGFASVVVLARELFITACTTVAAVMVVIRAIIEHDRRATRTDHD